MDPPSQTIRQLEIKYVRASRCWRSNNLSSCLLLCDQLTRELNEMQSLQQRSEHLDRLKNLVWYLKIRCLADDYYSNEPLLLNDDDLDDEDSQVKLINQRSATAARLNSSQSSAATIDNNNNSSSTTTTTSRPLTAAAGRAPSLAGRKLTTAAATGSRMISSTSTTTNNTHARHRSTAILTGKRSSLSSRQSSQQAGAGTSSYRPLTTSLTATQTAFSRSTRPLLKYAACSLLAKDLFEYLYNVQTITNKCPDYRQCLEYLNLVQKKQRLFSSSQTRRKRNQQQTPLQQQQANDGEEILLDIFGESPSDSANDHRSLLGCFWLNSFGICYFNLRMNKEAEEYFTCSRELNPKCLDAYAWLVKVYLRTSQPGQVLRVCQLGLQHCKSSILYNWMARVQSLVNDLYKANLSLRESLNYHPTNIEALANVAHFAFYADKPELSLKCFERIQQLSINQAASLDLDYLQLASFAQLLNNLALSNFHCGHYHKVVPLFFKALLHSPNKEVTSDIWYNLSFVPVSCGFINLSIACLKLALRNDSQNIEALNNLGVLKCRSIVQADDLHFANRQELWGLGGGGSHRSSARRTSSAAGQSIDDNQQRQQQQQQGISLDDVQAFFRPPAADWQKQQQVDSPPEMLYNMAVIEKKRGQLLASMQYCQLYQQHDQNNYHIQEMMREIRQLVSHNGL